MPAIDITDTMFATTPDFEAAVALAALDAEMDGDYEMAEQIRKDGAEAIMLAEMAA